MKDNKKFWGKLASIDLHGCNDHIKHPEKIKEFIIKLCKEINMERHGEVLIDSFGEGKLWGYSCMQFIETSSITCHFDHQMSETNRAFIDIFSCMDFDENKAAKFCKRFFSASDLKLTTLIRN